MFSSSPFIHLLPDLVTSFFQVFFQMLLNNIYIYFLKLIIMSFSCWIIFSWYACICWSKYLFSKFVLFHVLFLIYTIFPHFCKLCLSSYICVTKCKWVVDCMFFALYMGHNFQQYTQVNRKCDRNVLFSLAYEKTFTPNMDSVKVKLKTHFTKKCKCNCAHRIIPYNRLLHMTCVMWLLTLWPTNKAVFSTTCWMINKYHLTRRRTVIL